MAKIVADGQLNMTIIKFLSGEFKPDPHHITITVGADSNEYSGNFSYSGGALSGTLDGFVIKHSGTAMLTVSQLHVDVGWMFAELQAGNGQLVYESLFKGADTIIGSAKADWLYGFAGNDTIKGGSGADTLFGADGNDHLIGGTGNDSIVGGNGSDWADFTGSAAVTVDLAKTTAQSTGYGKDIIKLIENITSGSGNDHLKGNDLNNTFVGGSGNDVLYGLSGKDTLTGGSGADTLYGGLGNDTLTGGSGADVFVFNKALSGTNVDKIFGYNAADDLIRLENGIFTGLPTGVLGANAFKSNTTGLAEDSTDHIIYNSSNGKIYFDKDGVGGSAGVLFATLDKHPTLTNSEFFVV